MKANDIKCLDYNPDGQNGMIFVLEDITPQHSLELDWSVVNITTDDGDLVEVIAGYSPRSAKVEATTNYVYLELVTGYEAETLAAIKKLAEENAMLKEELDIQGNLLEAMLEAEEVF